MSRSATIFAKFNQDFDRFSSTVLLGAQSQAPLLDLVASDASGKALGTITDHGIYNYGYEWEIASGTSTTHALYLADEWQINDRLRLDGNKRIFTVSGVDATPSYLPTPARAGTWALLMGVPNMRKDARADYTAKVYFSRTLAVADEPAILRQPLRAAAGWYRGDLHSHTGHSDGSCAIRSGGQPVPCPLFLTAQAAAARGLDFMAITEHNGIARANAIRERQPYFDRLLLMTGRELTSFFGSMAPVDFRVDRGQNDWNALLAKLPVHGLA